MSRLDGRVFLVTGAARGQGEQEARLFREEGAEVVVADVLDEQGRALAEKIGALYVHLDVGEEEGWRSAVREAKRAYGRLDGLVNNAGVLRFNTLVDTPLDEFTQVVRANQVGCFLGIRTVAPELAGGGTIVNTASYTGLTGMRTSARTPPPSTRSSASPEWPRWSWHTRASGSTRSAPGPSTPR